MDTSWITTTQRQQIRARTATNLFTIAFSKDISMTEEQASSIVEVIEKKAFTAAQVAATTTTGSRPVSETRSAYARKLSELLVEAIKSGGQLPGGAAPAAGAPTDVLDLTGSRDFLTKDSAEEVLQPLLAAGSAISRVKFSTKSFGRDAALVAAQALSNISTSLTEADISDIIAGRPEDEALEALRTISKALAGSKLRLLNLSDNALGEKGVRACAEAFAQQAALESISLQNVGCSIHACHAVEELLQHSRELRRIHLFNNMSDNEGAAYIARILSRAPRMEDFRMASSRVGPQGGIALAHGLMAGTNLVKLDVSDNPMTAEVASALADVIRQHPNIRILNLNDTSLTDKGVIVVSKALAEAGQQLEELELALNEITPTGAKAVAAALLNKPKLRRINLRENELEDRGAVVLSKALHGVAALQHLDVSGNQLRRVGATAVAKAVRDLADLELLALDENMISENGLTEVRELFHEVGKAHALGPMDENMEEQTEEEEEEEEGEDELTASLTAALAKSGLA